MPPVVLQLHDTFQISKGRIVKSQEHFFRCKFFRDYNTTSYEAFDTFAEADVSQIIGTDLIIRLWLQEQLRLGLLINELKVFIRIVCEILMANDTKPFEV